MGSFAFLGVLLVVFDLLLLAVDNDLTKQNLHSDTDDNVDGEDNVTISPHHITIIMSKAVAIINVFDEDDEQYSCNYDYGQYDDIDPVHNDDGRAELDAVTWHEDEAAHDTEDDCVDIYPTC